MKPLLIQKPYPQFTRHQGIYLKPLLKYILVFLFFIQLSIASFTQSDSSRSAINTPMSLRLTNNTDDNAFVPSSKSLRKRQWLIGGLSVAGYGGTLLLLNNTWYKDYPHTSFQTFNDSKEWLQVDKIGHAWTAYNTGLATTAMWEWAGLEHKKAVLIGGLSGFAFLTGIEFLDAHSAKWGWSWSDIGANIVGSGLFMGQEFLWGEQRINYKFSFHRNQYGDPQLEARANGLFGSSWYERMLKDYNAQTYWFSANIRSFFPRSRIPSWLNIAAGYGAAGMFGGFSNTWVSNGDEINRHDIARTRQFYLAPDIDFTKIPTKSKLLRTTFTILNSFKFPSPALMLNSKGKFKAMAIYF